MKKIVIKKDNKLVIRFVPDDYVEPEKELRQRDLTTSDAKYIGYSDISNEKWDKIFKKSEKIRKM